MSSSVKPSRRRLRFGLLELLLITGAIAAWLPTIIANRQLPELQSKVERYRSYTSDLIRVDPNQLCLRNLTRISSGTLGWKYFLPADAEMEIRLATEQLSRLNLPSQYDAVKLPEGEHRLYLREFRDSKKDYVKQVYVDDEIVLTSRHPKSWLKSSGSSWSNRTTINSKAYALTETLNLKNARYRIDNYAGKGNRISFQPPDEYDAKGCCLWIAPANHVEEPTPNFVSPKTPKFYRSSWGNREGIQIINFKGLIKVVPGFEARYVNPSQAYNSISVRPIVADSAGINGEKKTPKLPELQQSHVNSGRGLRIVISETVDSPDWNNPSPLERTVPQDAISQDGKTMRIFCHYENYSSGFRNDARPVIETIFDADHPNRIGLLPHQAADSETIKAIQIVTTMDARFRRRKIDLIVDDGKVETVPLPKQEKPADKSNGESGNDAEAETHSEDLWQTIPLEQIPTDQSVQMRKLKFSTDVKDFTTATLPPTVDPEWAYEGVPNCQTWWLPLSDTKEPADQDFKVEILQTDRLPTEIPPPATITIPGGPVIKSVRITIPMPATEPIWLEIAPDPQ
ncbi:hypothetical protein OAG71_00965 [bacterium]|nr:hypothetical protein [bacterium]